MERVLLITAHPDDEVVFFSPLLVSCQKRGASFDILCLSNGNVEGLGKVRSEELAKAGSLYGIPSQNITVIDHAELQDGMKAVWPITVVANIVLGHLLARSYSKVNEDFAIFDYLARY